MLRRLLCSSVLVGTWFAPALAAQTSLLELISDPGDYIGGLVAGVPVLLGAGSRTDHLAALIASSAELSTFSRNLHHLTKLLCHGEVRPAQEYRPMLDTLGADVRSHLALVAGALADLRPRGGITAAGRSTNE